MKAICVGHSTYDTTLPIEGFIEENKKYRITTHVECGGGPASNGAYLLAKWGVDTIIASIIGKDYFGDKIVEDFKKIGANTKYLEQRDNYETTNSYIIANMKNGSRTIISSKREKVNALNKTITEKADVILIDGEHPKTAMEVLENNKKAISILDAGRVSDDTIRLGKKVTYLVCSKKFAEEFTKKKIDTREENSMKKVHKELEEYFKTNIIITLESAGTFTKIDDEYIRIPSIRVKSLDSTGAGDIFHGAFAYFIGNNYPLKTALRLAAITGGISVTRIGSRYSIPTIEEVLEYDNTI